MKSESEGKGRKLSNERDRQYEIVKNKLGLEGSSNKAFDDKVVLFFRKLGVEYISSIVVSFIVLLGIFLGGLTSFLFLLDVDIQVRDFSYVVAVLLAGIVSFAVSETNKENEINKHREKWCSELRGYISEFAASVNSFQSNIFKGEGGKRKSPFEVVEKFYENSENCEEPLRDLDRLHHLLAIYLYSEWSDKPERKIFNKAEGIKNGLRESLSDIQENMVSAKEGMTRGAMEVKNESLSKRINKLCSEDVLHLVLGAKVYLDEEWREIKRGRPWFKIKRGFLISLIAYFLSVFVVFIAFSKNGDKELDDNLNSSANVECEVFLFKKIENFFESRKA